MRKRNHNIYFESEYGVALSPVLEPIYERELIYFKSSLDLDRSVVHTHFSKIFFSETAWPIKLQFYVEHPWVGVTKV